MSLLYEDTDRIDPNDLCHVDANANASATRQQATGAAMNSGAPRQQSVASAAQQQAVACDSEARDSLASKATMLAAEQKRVACHPGSGVANNMLNGSATATKLVYVSGLFKKSKLNDGAVMSFDRAMLSALFSVHARDSNNRDQRRGDVGGVTVNEISLLSTFNGIDVPVELSGTGAMKGKTYGLAYETGRQSGKHRNLLWVMNPGGHHYHKPVVIYRRVKQELMHLARIAGSFDMTSITQGVMAVDDSNYMVASACFVSAFIQRNSAKWNVPWTSFEQILKGSFRVIPKSLVDFAIGLLTSMRGSLEKNQHDLGALAFHCATVCSRGSMTSEYCSDDAEILIGMHALITYTFLQPHKLLTAYTPQ